MKVGPDIHFPQPDRLPDRYPGVFLRLYSAAYAMRLDIRRFQIQDIRRICKKRSYYPARISGESLVESEQGLLPGDQRQPSDISSSLLCTAPPPRRT